MLMSAGLGTRLKPFTDLEPKALIPVMGVPTAQFSMDALVRANVQTVVANIHHQADIAKAGLERLDRSRARLIISDESALLMGSGGGIAKALPHFGDKPFFWLNADVISDVDLNLLAKKHTLLRERYGVSLTLTLFSKPAGSGQYREVFLDPNASSDVGLVQGLGEVVANRPYFVSVGVIEPELFKGISADEPSDFLAQILMPAVAKKKVGYFLTQGKWFDVGSPAVWLETHVAMIKMLETGQIPQTWRRRIELLNKRIAQDVWISKDAKRYFKTAQIVAPAYFNSLGDSTAQPPKLLGPEAVVYGDAFSYEGPFSKSIGLRGLISKV
jgi:MurNAc alpha-1-phosphate uridylyltransferase